MVVWPRLLILIILDSAVGIVTRTIKLMKIHAKVEKFFETVLTCTVKKIFSLLRVDSDD